MKQCKELEIKEAEISELKAENEAKAEAEAEARARIVAFCREKGFELPASLVSSA